MKKLVSVLCLLAILSASVLCFASCGDSKAVKLIDIKLTEEEYAFACADNAEGDALLTSVNEMLVEMKADGSFDAIVNKYFGDGTPTGYDGGTLDTSKDQLVVATNAAFEPFEYMEGDKYCGIDIELMAALATKLGKELVIKNIDFDSVLTDVEQGYSDIVAAGLTYNEERDQTVNFSNTYYKASQMVVVKGDDTTFDNCKTPADVQAILDTLTKNDKVGAQNGTTGMLFLQGDTDEDGNVIYKGCDATCRGYKSAALAINDMVNGNIRLVVVDEGPANIIVKKMNQ